jgi:hypothetical protein
LEVAGDSSTALPKLTVRHALDPSRSTQALPDE